MCCPSCKKGGWLALPRRQKQRVTQKSCAAAAAPLAPTWQAGKRAHGKITVAPSDVRVTAGAPKAKRFRGSFHGGTRTHNLQIRSLSRCLCATRNALLPVEKLLEKGDSKITKSVMLLTSVRARDIFPQRRRSAHTQPFQIALAR